MDDTQNRDPIDTTITAQLGVLPPRKGWALSLLEKAGEGPDGKKVTVEVRDTLPPVDDFEPPPAFRNHTIGDTASFIAYARRYGKPADSLIFYSDDGASLTIEESPKSGEREVIGFAFTYSPDWIAWSKVLNGQPLDHKALLKLLLLQSHNLSTPAVLASMRTVEVTTTIKLDSDIKEEGDKFSVACETSGGEKLKTFPKSFDIQVPVLREDMGTDAVEDDAELCVRLEVEMPTEPRQPVRFSLICPEVLVERAKRVDAEIQTIRDELDGWLIVRGGHREKARLLGTKAHKLNRADEFVPGS